MDIADIQARLDKMPAAMNAKGLRNPDAEFQLNSNAGPRMWLKWTKADANRPYDKEYHRVEGDTLEAKLDAADAFIEGLPSIEETRMAEFTTHLAATIELGHANGIDVAYVNPLTETMKRLSENALTYQK